MKPAAPFWGRFALQYLVAFTLRRRPAIVAACEAHQRHHAHPLKHAQARMLDMGKLFEHHLPAPGTRGAGAFGHTVGRRSQ